MDYFIKHYEDLVGYKVSSVTKDTSDLVPFYGLVLTKNKQSKVAWVLQDPEGNGPGFLEINTNKLSAER